MLLFPLFLLWACQPIEYKLQITEILTQNTRGITDDFGEHSDWIEIANMGEESINISGFGLSDDLSNPHKWRFPYQVLRPDEYMLIFASNRDRRDSTAPLHTNFRLQKDGEPLQISDGEGSLIHQLPAVQLLPDISWGLQEGENLYFLEPTPGKANQSMGYPLLSSKEGRPLLINEVQAGRNSWVLDDGGELSDWIEIYNPSNQEINLLGYGLSDDLRQPFRWRFPNISIGSGKYMLLYASGKERTGHCNFRLREGESIGLFGPDGMGIDILSSIKTSEEGSYGRYKNQWMVLATPTPGAENGSPLQKEAKNIRIDEVMAEDDNSPFQSDWLELYNISEEPFQLFGHGLSDSKEEPLRWVFPEAVIGAKSRLLIYLDGLDCGPPKCKGLHANFKLSPQGEKLYLRSPSGKILDAFQTGYLRRGISRGRDVDNPEKIVFFDKPTPNKKNAKTSFDGYAKAPKIKTKGGFFSSKKVEITLHNPLDKQHLRYTTDGRAPTNKSKKYNKAILIQKNTHLRVKAFRENHLPSPEVSEVYLLRKKHDYPIFAFAVDPGKMFDSSRGLYTKGPGASEEYPYKGANFWSSSKEEPISFRMLNKDGDLLYAAQAGVRIFGGYSRAEIKKAFRIIARSKYGQKEFVYPFLSDRSRDRYDSFVLRAGGQDFRETTFRDVLINWLTRDIDLDQQSYRPVIVYINGAYWGAYNIREKINENYLNWKYGYSPDSITILGHSDTSPEFRWLLKELKKREPEDNAEYEWLQQFVDVETVRDWMLVQLFTANVDIGNVRIWRSSQPGSKWRYMLFDSDLSWMSSTFPTLNFVTGRRARYRHQHISGWLLKNPRFQKNLYRRAKYFYDDIFSPKHYQRGVDHFTRLYDKEMKEDRPRWRYRYEGWQRMIKLMNRRFAERRIHSRGLLKRLLDISSDQLDKDFPQDKKK